VNIDAINAGFELTGAVMNWFNLAALVRDKEIKGVHWFTTVIYCSWGLWHVVYFSELNQPLSFAGNALGTLANVCWLLLLFKLSLKQHKGNRRCKAQNKD
jgi:hypothetical protein